MTSLLHRPAVRTWTVAARLLLLTVAATVVYTLVITAVGQVVLPAQANGSTMASGGRVVGSTLIGQSFTDAKGRALPQWFQSRPSASGYDATASGGSNLGPDSAVLIQQVERRRAAYLALNGSGSVPLDAVTASASGLDPDISVENALRQADRVAGARGLPVATVRRLVERTEETPTLGFLGQPVVNVLRLNLALGTR